MTSYGVLLPTFDPMRRGGVPEVVSAARLAESLGFDGVWAGDHLACPAPGFDAPTCLAAAAAVTDRLTIGFSVMLLGLRPPAWAAKQLATLQALSGARVKLGVGVGGEFPREFEAAGVRVDQRGARLDETLAVLPDLLSARAVQTNGRALQLMIPPLEPSVPVPPVLVGGRGEPALRRAARFGDAWLPMWLTPETLAQRAERLAELADEHGRPRPSLALLVGVHVDTDEARAREEAAGFLNGQYGGLPLDRVASWTLLGSPSAVAERLAAYREVGVQEFVFMGLTSRPLEQIERLAEVVAELGARAAA